MRFAQRLYGAETTATECDVPVLVMLNFLVVSEPIGKTGDGKKYWNRYRKNLVLELIFVRKIKKF